MSKINVNHAVMTVEEKQAVIEAGVASLVKSEKLDNAAILAKYDTDFLFLSGAVSEAKKLAVADNKARETILGGSARMFSLYFPIYGIDSKQSAESYGKPDIEGFCTKVYETFGDLRESKIDDNGKVKYLTFKTAAAHKNKVTGLTNKYAQVCESMFKWINTNAPRLFTTIEKIAVTDENGVTTEIEKVVPTFQTIRKSEVEKEIKALDNHFKGIQTLSGHIIENVTLDIQAFSADGTPLNHADGTPVMVSVKMNSMALLNAVISQTNKELSEQLKLERETRAAKIENDKIAKGDVVLPELAEKIAA
jgi:hypothetical protein